MELELLRLLEDSAKDVTIGINAMIATVPRDGGDAAPTNVATILCEANNAELARGIFPAASNTIVYPVVAIVLESDLEVDGESITVFQDAKAKVVVMVGHLASDTQDASEQLRYTTRAIRKWVNRLAWNENAAQRTRNGIELVAVTGMRPIRPFRNEKDKTLTAGVAFDCDLRDNAP